MKKLLLYPLLFLSQIVWAYTPGKWSHLDHYIFNAEKSRPVKEEVKNSSQETIYTAEFEYNKKGNLEKETYKNKAGAIEGYTIYTYREDKIFKEELFDSNNKLKERKDYYFDKQGSLTKIVLLDSSNKEIATYKIKGSFKEELKNVEVYWSETKDYEYYNIKKDLESEYIYIQEVQNEGRDLIASTKYMYDNSGKLISRLNVQGKNTRQSNIKYNDSGKISSYTFHVKQNNNWDLIKTHTIYYNE